MADKDQTAEHLRKSLHALIKGQRSNLSLYGTVIGLGSALAIGLFLWSWFEPGVTNVLAMARNAVPLVPTTVCVPQLGVCISKIAQYKAIEELARHHPEAALRALEQLLSK
jgi:hypothetical protein